ncbi:MAG: [LysW]-lysine hydrolase [Anaerolineales bacterium]
MDEAALLEGLLTIYSPSYQEAEAVNYLVTHMSANGLDAHVDEIGNAVGVVGATDAPLTVMLLGHIDTVPGFIPVTRDGDRLNGRGAVDAKGPLAAFTAAAIRVRGELKTTRLIVIGAVAEEGDSRGAHFIKDKYRPDFTVIGEPSGWEKITLGYKGSAWFEYAVQRTLAHTSARNESACEAAVAFWNRVTAWAAERNGDNAKMFEQVIPTLREMSSNSDGLAESARLKFGVRLPPGFTVPDLESALRGLTAKAELTLAEGVAAYRGEKNTVLVRTFLSAIRHTGGNPSFSVKSGTSDMNVVAPVWGTPILAYGPGDSALDHTPEEHILLSEFQRSVAVLTTVLGALERG